MKLSELIKDMPYLLGTQGDMDIDIGAVSCNMPGKDRPRTFLLHCGNAL